MKIWDSVYILHYGRGDAYRVEKHGDVDNLWNVKNEIVVDDLSECRHSHKVDGRLFMRRQSKENEKRFQ